MPTRTNRCKAREGGFSKRTGILTAFPHIDAVFATVAQMPDLLAQKAVESGYDLIRQRPLSNSTVLIPAVLLTRESAPKTGGWVQ